MDKSNSQQDRYLELLEAILENVKNLRFAGARLLEYERSRSYALFLLYQHIEECGKFLIVKDLYPKPLTKGLLEKAGFSDHDKKIERIVSNFERVSLIINPSEDIKKMSRIVRKLRENSLYVDYKNRPVKPGLLFSKGVLDDLVKLVGASEKFCKQKLKEFKGNPFLS